MGMGRLLWCNQPLQVQFLLRQPAPQQRQAEADHIGEAALNPLHQGPAAALQGKTTSALQGLAAGHVVGDFQLAQGRELHPGGHRAQSLSGASGSGVRTGQQAMARMQLPPAAGHQSPALDRFGRMAGFTKNFASKGQHRIAAQYRRDVGVSAPIQQALHSPGLGLGQQQHQLSGLGVLNRFLIHAAHLHSMGNGGLLQQTAPGRRGRGQQQHGTKDYKLGKTMAADASFA